LVKFLGEDTDLKPQAEEIRAIKWVFPMNFQLILFPKSNAENGTIIK